MNKPDENEMLHKQHNKNIYSRLCLKFKEQVLKADPESRDVWISSEATPWINSHPWSVRGIPEDFSEAVFSVQRDLCAEFAKVTDSYDPERANVYYQAADTFKALHNKQFMQDMDFLLKKGQTEDQMRILKAASLFIEEHDGDKHSPYNQTSILADMRCLGYNIETFLTQGYQAIYGTRHL
tara:strand:- start:176007 stop:176549 length:543 start_codon:yes stop_codon:yes gene_type:complete